MTVSRSFHSFPVQHKQCGGGLLCHSIAQGFRSYYVTAFLQYTVQDCPGIIQLAGRRERRGKVHLFTYNFCSLTINKLLPLSIHQQELFTCLSCAKGSENPLIGRVKEFGRHLASLSTVSRLCLCLTFSSSLPGSPSFAKLIYPGDVIF